MAQFQNNIASKRTVDVASRKREKFDLHHTVATTMPFGYCQPIHTYKMIPNSKHNVSVKSLVRFTPMVAPTSSGRVSMKMWHKFVGVSDLYRNHASLLTQQPIAVASGLKVMSKLPHIKHCNLSSLVLTGCSFSIYERVTGGNPESWGIPKTQNEAQNTANFIASKVSNPFVSATSAGTSFAARYSDYVAGYSNYAVKLRLFSNSFENTNIPTANKNSLANSAFNWNLGAGKYVEIGDCDYVFERQFDDNGTTRTFAIAVNLSDYGKRLQSVLVGLGYGVDFNSQRNVDLTRFLAYYKAYYDTFGLCLYMNWESTSTMQFCRCWENGDTNFAPVSVGAGTLDNLFVLVVNEIVGAFVTDPVDYISSHRKTDAVGVSDLGFVQNIVVASPNSANPYGAFTQDSNPENEPAGLKTTTNAIFINQVTHTQVDADLLKLLYKSINRQTVAGRRIAELLRAAGYGAFVDNMHSSFIGMTEVDIDVSDINATADSSNAVTGNNSVLGEVAGKGVGYNKNWHKDNVTYETDEFGYWITLCACVPDAGYSQGNDLTVYDVDKFGQYSLEFDAQGYELSPKSLVVSGADWNIEGQNDSDVAFGLTPRFTRYKFAHNILNGDFKRRSTRAAFLPYTLDRFIQVNDGVVTLKDDTPSGFTGYLIRKTSRTSELPVAGNAWRYVNRYPWLATFERIFTYFAPMQYIDYNNSADLSRYFYCAQTSDNIMLFALVNDDCYAPMLSVGDSFGTTDDNDGKGTPMAQA